MIVNLRTKSKKRMSNSARKSLVINSNPSPRQHQSTSQSFLAVSSTSPFANVKIDENFFGPQEDKKSDGKNNDKDDSGIVVVEEDDGEVL